MSLLLLLLTALLATPAVAAPADEFLAWQAEAADRPRDRADGVHPEPGYRFTAELMADVAAAVRDRPGVVTPFMAGRSVTGQPLWAFRVRRPGTEPKAKLLVFGGIHALEWISAEVATSFLVEIIARPPPGVEVVVLPLLNPDGRDRVEGDLVAGEQRYRRANFNGVDLNRDFAVNREAVAVWKALIPGYYATSPAPLSQPESKTIDRLGAEGFDVSISLHAFGGFLYYPWAGRFERPDDRDDFERLGRVMAAGQGAHAYKVRQLSRWGFFFRAQGAELDHLYGTYGTRAFLIELTRSGIEPFHPATWKDPFRMYNPRDPTPHIAQGTGALRALAWHLSVEGPP